MKFILLFLAFIIFGCSVERRLHRPGFHFNKHSIKHNSTKEKNTASLENKIVFQTSEDSIRNSATNQIELEKFNDQSQRELLSEKETTEKISSYNSQLNIERELVVKNQQKISNIKDPKVQEEKPKGKQLDDESSVLSIIANILAIASFVFAILTVLLIILAFIMSYTLILPLLTALPAFFSGGFSLLVNLISKNDNYKSRLALIGLFTSLIFFAFFILILSGVILI